MDSGTHYRALTALLLEQGLIANANQTVARFLKKLSLDTVIDGHQAVLQIQGRTFSSKTLRSLAVNAHVSPVAALPAVRDILLHYQRSLAPVARQEGFCGLIMEGRDIGSVIFPDARWHFFLEADCEIRKNRRARQGFKDTINTRDQIDAKRRTAPLVQPRDAIVIDTVRYNQHQVVAQVTQIIQNSPLTSANRIHCTNTPIVSSNRRAIKRGTPLERVSLWYLIAASVAKVFCDDYCQEEVYGLENIPRSGSFIIAANHTSYLDVPIVGNRYALWRPIAYLGRKNLFFRHPLAWLLRRLNPVMVDLESEANINAIKHILKVLNAGSGLLAFPEIGGMRPFL